MNITLHDATEQVRALLDQIDPDTGEMPAELGSARAVVMAKAVAVTAWVVDTERGADAAEDYAKELLARVKRARAKAAWCKQYLMAHMLILGVEKITDERGIFSARIRNNPEAVDVFDPAQLPAEFMRIPEPPPPAPDKVAIKAAIKSGQDVPGARLTQSQRLEVK